MENMAATIGPSKISWWRDWRGECVAILASGPSMKKEDVEALRDRIHVIAIKENVNLCPWADVVYGCDAAWWKHRRGLPEFKGLKLVYDVLPESMRQVNRIEIKKAKAPGEFVHEILTDVPGVIGSGGNSGFQALNVAAQFGATGVLLLGYDADARGGVHWYGRNRWPQANNPAQDNFERWRKSLEGAGMKLKSLGIDVINGSEGSALKLFPKMSVALALHKWGL